MRSSEFRTYTGLLTLDGLINGRPEVTVDATRHLVMPVITLSVFHWATLGRVTRASIIEETHKGYVPLRTRAVSRNGEFSGGTRCPTSWCPASPPAPSAQRH